MASFLLSKVSESIGQIDRILQSTITNPSKPLVTTEDEVERQGKPLWGLDLNYAANNLMVMAEPRADAVTEPRADPTTQPRADPTTQPHADSTGEPHNDSKIPAMNQTRNYRNVDLGDQSTNSVDESDGCSPATSPDCLNSTEMGPSRGPLHETDDSIPTPRSQSPCTPLHVNITKRTKVASEKPHGNASMPNSKGTETSRGNGGDASMPKSSNSKGSETPRGNCPARVSTYLMRHHPSHHLLFNISSTLPSPRTKFLLDNQIVNLPWKCAGVTAQSSQNTSKPDNNADKLPDCPTAASIPTLTCLLDICYAIDAYLKLDPKNTAVVYCSNGKTRTGIAVAAYLRYTNKASTTFQGFRTFCARTFRDLISLEQIDELIPPSLKTLFWNFDALLESGGAIQKEKMNLRAVTLQGVPVEDMPRLDIWDGNGLVYSSHISCCENESREGLKNVDDAIESENKGVNTMDTKSRDRKSVMWADEEGFYKVNKPLFGDFLLLCRFGGQFAQDTADPSKVILRYANNTAFLFPGPCELPKIKVDVMRRYADSISEEDFLITFLFERGSRTSSSLPQAPKVTGRLGEWNYLPDILEGKSAVERGWSLISEYHCVSLGLIQCIDNAYSCNESDKIETSLAILQNYYHGKVGAISARVATPNLLLLSVSVQLSNNNLTKAVDDFLEDRMKPLWKDVSYPFLFSLPLREEYEGGKIDSPPSLPALKEEDIGYSKEDSGRAYMTMSAKSHTGCDSSLDLNEQSEQDEHLLFVDMLDNIDFGLDIEAQDISCQNTMDKDHTKSTLNDVIQGTCNNPNTNSDFTEESHIVKSQGGRSGNPALSHLILCNSIIFPTHGDVTNCFSDVRATSSDQDSLSYNGQYPELSTLSHVGRPKLRLHNDFKNNKRKRHERSTKNSIMHISEGKHRKGTKGYRNYPLLDNIFSSATTLLESYHVKEGIDLSTARQNFRFGKIDISNVEYDDCYRLVLSEMYNGIYESSASRQTKPNLDIIAAALLNDNKESALSMMMQINHKNVRVDDLMGLIRDSRAARILDSEVIKEGLDTFEDSADIKNHEDISENTTKNIEHSNSKIGDEGISAMKHSVDDVFCDSTSGGVDLQHSDSRLCQRNESMKRSPTQKDVSPEAVKLSGMHSPLAVFGGRFAGLGNRNISGVKPATSKRNFFAKRSIAVYGNEGNVADQGNDHVTLGTKVPLVISGSSVEKSGQVIGKDAEFYTVQIPADAFIQGQIVITDKTAAAAAADAAAKALVESGGRLVSAAVETITNTSHPDTGLSLGGVAAATVIANAKEEKKIGEPALKDDPEYAKYFKMLESGVLLDDVKLAMKKDGKDPTIMDGDHNKPCPAHILLKEEPEFTKYFKLLKAGLTIDDVKNAMKRDDKDPRIIDLNPNLPLKTQKIPGSVDNESESEEGDNKTLNTDVNDDNLPLKEDPEYMKYFKMLKMGLPIDVVKHALKRDGKDESVMDLDPEKSLKSQLKSNDDEEDNGPPLKEDPEYEKYFKMLKMGLPVGAVKNALKRDGKDESVMDLDPEKSLISQTKKEKKKPKGKPKGKLKKKKAKVNPVKVRRKKIYWNAVDENRIGRNSIWGQIQGIINMDKLVYDTSEFETLFTETLDSSQKKKSNEASNDSSAKKTKKIVQIIDGKRGMNGGIILARLKIGFVDIANIIDCMACDKFDFVQLKALKEFLPTDEERQGLDSYLTKATTEEAKQAAIAELNACEQYMVAMTKVTNSSKKFDCLIFESQFISRMEETTESIMTLTNACDAVKESERLRKLMAVILSLGNKINTGGTGNMANGFTLDALLKLEEAKAFDRKTSVLQYLVRILGPYDKDLLNFKEDISSSIQAENIMLDALSTEIKDLKEEFKVVKDIAKEDGESRRNEDGKLLNLTIKKSLTELKEQKSSVREVNGVKFYNQMEHVVEYTPMEIFSESAEKRIQDACAQIEETQKKFVALLEYFGEDENMKTTDFFGILNKFTNSFQVAKDYVDKQAENKRKEKKRAEAQQAKEAKKLSVKLARDAKLQRPDSAGTSISKSSVVTGSTRMKRRGSGDSESTFGISSEVRAILKDDGNLADRKPINTLIKPKAVRGVAHFVAKATLNKKNQDTTGNSELPSESDIENRNKEPNLRGGISAYNDSVCRNIIDVNAAQAAAIDFSLDNDDANATIKDSVCKEGISYDEAHATIDSLAGSSPVPTSKPMSDKLERELRKLNTSYNPTLPEEKSNIKVLKHKTLSAAEDGGDDKHQGNPFAEGGIAAAAAAAAVKLTTKRQTRSSDKGDTSDTDTPTRGGVATAANAVTKRKNETSQKGNVDNTKKLSSRQIAANAAAAAAAEADAEAALRRKTRNPLAFRGIVNSAALSAATTKTQNSEETDTKNNEASSNNSAHTGKKVHKSAKNAVGSSSKSSANPSAGGEIAAAAAQAGANFKVQNSTSTKESGINTKKSVSNVLAAGGIAAAAAAAAQAKSNKIAISSEGDDNNNKSSAGNLFAGGGIAAAAAQAAASRTAKMSGVDKNNSTNDSSNAFDGDGIAAAAAQAAASRKTLKSVEDVVNSSSKSSANPSAGGGIAAAAAQAAAKRKAQSPTKKSGINTKKRVSNPRQKSLKKGAVNSSSKSSANPSAGGGIAAAAAQAGANRKAQNSTSTKERGINTKKRGGTAAAAAAQKRNLHLSNKTQDTTREESRPTNPFGVSSIASAAAQAALKRNATKNMNESNDEFNLKPAVKSKAQVLT